MRFTVSQVYRAFPELDKFPDAQCEAYVRRAWRGRSMIGGSLMAITAAVIFIPGGFCLIFALGAAFGDLLQSFFRDPLAGMLTIIVTSFACSGIAALILKDRWLRWAIKRQITSSRCPRCQYVLLGLAVHDGVVTCPECGMSLVLADIGLTPAGLLSPSA